MKEILDFTFTLSKEDILDQILTNTNLAVDDPLSVSLLVDKLHSTPIKLKLSCELNADDVDIEIVAVQDDTIIKDSGIVLKNGYILK